ncbi:MAG: hypothetical protein R3Y28_05375 [Candidatus Gastranaerophilales bacterium]
MTKRFDKSSVIPNSQIFDCDEKLLLERVQSDNRIPLRWNASEQRQKAKTTLFALQFNASKARRGGNEVDGFQWRRNKIVTTPPYRHPSTGGEFRAW